MAAREWQRVRATYASRHSSCTQSFLRAGSAAAAAASSAAGRIGNIPSSHPGRNTTSHSSPFDRCTVSTRTLPPPASS